MSGAFDMKPLTSTELEHIARVAGRLWAIETGGLVSGTPSAGVPELHLVRGEPRRLLEFPTLVDESLVWLVLENYRVGEPLVALTWTGGSVTHRWVRRPADRATFVRLEMVSRRILLDAHASLRGCLTPSLERIEVGRGAWEQAGHIAEGKGTCRECPYSLGSNLDCTACRVALIARRDPEARWDRAAVRDGLLALEFSAEVADEAAAATERALGQVESPLWTAAFFAQWTAAFAEESASVFANDDDRAIASDLIEAQMLQPWFGLPPKRPRPPGELIVPPARTDAELAREARKIQRDLVKAGVPQTEAARRLGALKVFRKLLLAQAELYGDGARVVGGVTGPALVVEQRGKPAVLVRLTAFGPHTTAAPWLGDAERDAILDGLGEIRRKLVDASKDEHARLGVDHTGRSIDLALERLRRGAPSSENGGSDVPA